MRGNALGGQCGDGLANRGFEIRRAPGFPRGSSQRLRCRRVRTYVSERAERAKGITRIH